jgi:hypothetical protein
MLQTHFVAGLAYGSFCSCTSKNIEESSFKTTTTTAHVFAIGTLVLLGLFGCSASSLYIEAQPDFLQQRKARNKVATTDKFPPRDQLYLPSPLFLYGSQPMIRLDVTGRRVPVVSGARKTHKDTDNFLCHVGVLLH